MNSILPYDKDSIRSIFEYSKGLLGKTLRDFIREDYVPKKGKGGVGQMVENLYFLLKTNSNPNADFSEAGIELKSTPLIKKMNLKKKEEEYAIKERLVCGMINYCKVINEDFEHSHFYLKCHLMLLLFYLYEKNIDKLDYQFIFSVLWRLPEKDLLIIRNDYQTIINKIKRGEAHLLSEGDTMYLGACRKGQKGENQMKQPYSDVTAPRRAFSLKMSYMRTILQQVVESKQQAITNDATISAELINKDALSKSDFEQLLLDRFTSFKGKQYTAIANELGVNIDNNPKNKFSIIANAIASEKKIANINQSEEFKKAGLTMKTIRLQANGKIKESMSFENIDYTEVAECDEWYDSRLYELFSSRFMFVIYRELHDKQGDYMLDKVFFWTMPTTDLETAELYWKHIREVVMNDHIGNGEWWEKSDKRKFHVRPKGRNAKDLVSSPKGTMVKKYCYWFNNEYVKEIVESHE